MDNLWWLGLLCKGEALVNDLATSPSPWLQNDKGRSVPKRYWWDYVCGQRIQVCGQHLKQRQSKMSVTKFSRWVRCIQYVIHGCPATDFCHFSLWLDAKSHWTLELRRALEVMRELSISCCFLYTPKQVSVPFWIPANKYQAMEAGWYWALAILVAGVDRNWAEEALGHSEGIRGHPI